MVKEGKAAPAFTATNADGATVKLKDLRGQKVVLYFYPKDDTPGCTKEACSFRDAFAAFKKRGIEVLGISPDSEASHKKFTTKYKLPFTLLADANHVDRRCLRSLWREEVYGPYVHGCEADDLSDRRKWEDQEGF